MDRITRQLRDSPQYAIGRGEAESDIARGSLAYCIRGKVVFSFYDEVAALLKSRYQIELRVDGHCITPLEDEARTTGYNERMAQEFVTRFGEDVIAAVSLEVERKRKKRR